MKVIGNLLSALFKAFFRTVFGFIIGAVIGGVGTLVAFNHVSSTSIWPLPGGFAQVFAIVVAVLAGYAVGLTVLAAAAVRGLVDAGEDVVKEATTAGNLAEDAVKHL